MKFLELNKKRHATKHFNDKPVDPKDVRTAIEIATLAPSAHNSQPWKFVVVRERNQDLAEIAFGSNQDQVKEAPVTIALFTDTDLTKRSRKIARVAELKISLMSSFNSTCRIYQLSLRAIATNKRVITWPLMLVW